MKTERSTYDLHNGNAAMKRPSAVAFCEPPGKNPSARLMSLMGSTTSWLTITTGKVEPGAMVAGTARPMMPAWAVRSISAADAAEDRTEGKCIGEGAAYSCAVAHSKE